MDSRVSLQPAYVLHRRPFQNSSLLIDFLTLDYGRLRAIAKGARRQKSRSRALLQLFSPLLISFSGRGEVKTLGQVEPQLNPIRLQGLQLFSGMYLNELLVRLLHNQEEHQQVYRHYQQALLGLQDSSQRQGSLEALLRRFELGLLSELGYALDLQQDCQEQRPIAPDSQYLFQPDIGFSPVVSEDEENSRVFLGRHLIALRELDLTDPQAAQAAKRLLRQALNVHLGDKPLASRELFTARPQPSL